MDTKKLKGFYQLSRRERVKRVCSMSDLTERDERILLGEEPLSIEIAEHLIENVVGYYPIPLGVATYFTVDGKSLFIPMAVEETSIIAAASSTAKWISKEGAIRTYAKGRLIIGQIQIPHVRDIEFTKKILGQKRAQLIEIANFFLPGLVQRGGGVRDIAIRDLSERSKDPMLVLHVLCDPCDAMGANLINQVCEALKPKIEELTKEKVGLCIVSNLVDTRLVGAEVTLRSVDVGLAQGIQEASYFAEVDPYRAATHNKGILNGIDAVLIATGNDWRAVEAGCHAYAARLGHYQPLSTWRREGDDLVGKIEIPLSVGTVGGVTRLHPMAQVALKILKVKSSEDLARICAAVGLVQNLGALRALATVGIVKGHMQLHAANLAIAAGAEIGEIDSVRDKLILDLKKSKTISLTRAKEILESIRVEKSESTYF